MKYTHESKELNALLGKKVKVTLFDDTTQNQFDACNDCHNATTKIDKGDK